MLPAVISATASGTTTVVAAVPNMKIRVLAYRLFTLAAVEITWKSGSTNITGAMNFPDNGGIAAGCMQMTPAGLTYEFETRPGEALVINLSLATTVGGHLLYRTVAE